MESLMILVLVIAAVLAVFIKGAADERVKQRRQKRKIHEGFGAVPDRDYSDEELSSIPGYFSMHQEPEQVDDITWNDLGMDQLFFRMNQTYSSAGQEYLYYLLRTPQLKDAKALDAMEEKITCFGQQEQMREQLQYAYMQLGRSGKYSVYDYLNYLDNLGERSSLSHIICDLLLIPAIGMVIVSPPIGMMFLFLLFTVNIFGYMKQKHEIEPYLTSFAYVRRILDFSARIRKMDIPVLKVEWEELKILEGKFGKFRYSAMLGMRGSDTAGDPLSLILDYVNMLLHLDLICFNTMLKEVRKHLTDIDRMITIAGKTEACIAIASYRASLASGWCSPRLTEDSRESVRLEIRGLYHPLLEEPVKNDILAKQGILVTGSNASGKSTFLKAVALNALLAQTIHTCTADFYSGGLYRIMTSMALRDDLEGGESYYIVEIKSLKRILDAAREGSAPVLCFVDEVLRGTNTVERIAASTQILRSLSRPGVLCFAATHDIELTELLADCYDNYHFEEEILEGDILFNYILRSGKAMTRNAIRLLGIIGYENAIIEEANALAAHFLETGNWT